MASSETVGSQWGYPCAKPSYPNTDAQMMHMLLGLIIWFCTLPGPELRNNVVGLLLFKNPMGSGIPVPVKVASHPIGLVKVAKGSSFFVVRQQVERADVVKRFALPPNVKSDLTGGGSSFPLGVLLRGGRAPVV